MHRRSLLAAGGALALAGCATTPTARSAGPIPVIFHTDIGGDVDDTWALLLLLRRPELDLKLVVVEVDNARYRARLVAKLLALAGRGDIPIALNPIDRDDPGPQSGWIGDFTLADHPGPILPDGAQAMVDVVMASPEPVTILTVGPATLAAAALKLEPAIARNARFVGMEGAIRLGYGGSDFVEPEYNVRVDPAALAAVFAAPWECTITPLDTCGLLIFDGPLYQTLLASSDPFARAVVANNHAWLPNAPWMPAGFDIDRQSSTQFDSVAVMMAFDESALIMETLPLTVRPDGMTVIDTAGRPVRCATGWRDMEAMRAAIVASLTSRPG